MHVWITIVSWTHRKLFTLLFNLPVRLSFIQYLLIFVAVHGIHLCTYVTVNWWYNSCGHTYLEWWSYYMTAGLITFYLWICNTIHMTWDIISAINLVVYQARNTEGKMQAIFQRYYSQHCKICSWNCRVVKPLQLSVENFMRNSATYTDTLYCYVYIVSLKLTTERCLTFTVKGVLGDKIHPWGWYPPAIPVNYIWIDFWMNCYSPKSCLRSIRKVWLKYYIQVRLNLLV